MAENQENTLLGSAVTSGGPVQQIKLPQEMTGSEVFQQQDLSAVLTKVTANKSMFVLWNLLPKEAAFSPTPFFDIQNALSDGSATSRSTEDCYVRTDRGDYARATVRLKRYLSRARVTFESTVYDKRYGGIKMREMENCVTRILNDVEHDLTKGNNLIVKEGNAASGGGVVDTSADLTDNLPKMDGLETQIRRRLKDARFLGREFQSWAVGAKPVQDLHGETLVYANIAAANIACISRNGLPDTLLAAPAALQNFITSVWESKAYNVLGIGGEEGKRAGMNIKEVTLVGGTTIRLVMSRYLMPEAYVVRKNVDRPVVSGGSVTAAVEATQGTSFGEGEVYKYRVCALNDASESAPIDSEAVTTTAGCAVNVTIKFSDISITQGGGVAQVFNVYRSKDDGATFYLIGRLVRKPEDEKTTLVFCDRNLKKENTSTAILAEINKEAMSFLISVPMSYFKLGVITNASENWMQMMIGSLAVKKVIGCTLFDNVKNEAILQ